MENILASMHEIWTCIKAVAEQPFLVGCILAGLLVGRLQKAAR